MRSAGPLLLALVLLLPVASASASQVHLAWSGKGYVVVFASTAQAPVVRWSGAGGAAGEVKAAHRVHPEGDGDAVWSAELPPEARAYEVEGRRFEVAAPPAPGDATRIAFVADVGRSEDSWRVLKAVEAAKPSLVLIGGDVTYANGVSAKWDEWLTRTEPLFSRVPLMTAFGNHETLCNRDGGLVQCSREPDEYLEHFPGVNDPHRFGAYDWGPARLVALDTEAYHPTTSPHASQTDPAEQKAFLAEALRARPDAWSIVYFHRPLYSSNLHDEGPDSGAKEDLVPTLEEGGADLVLYGHAHAYERSWPLKGDQVVARASAIREGDGVFYVDGGGGGRSLYTEFEEQPAWSAKREAAFQLVLVDVTPERLDVRALRPDGRVLDAFSVVREGAYLAPPADAPSEASVQAIPGPGAGLVAFALVAAAVAARRLRP